jgi:hypothetical protein
MFSEINKLGASQGCFKEVPKSSVGFEIAKKV